MNIAHISIEILVISMLIHLFLIQLVHLILLSQGKVLHHRILHPDHIETKHVFQVVQHYYHNYILEKLADFS